MATITDIRADAGLFAFIAETLKAQTARFTQYRTYSKTLSELQALSPRELDDLGLHRSMLREVAYEAAYGVKA